MNALINSTFNTFNIFSTFTAYPSVDPDSLVPNPVKYPIYYFSGVSVVPGIDDKTLSLIAPVLTYWVFSLFFHVLDSDIFQWAAKYRIHESEEVKGKNLASPKDVFLAVILQQVIQTLIGATWLIWLDPDSGSDGFRYHTGKMRQLSKWVSRLAVIVLGDTKGKEFLAANGPGFVSWLYWWGIPTAQFIFAIFVIDTWEYFIHRAMHMNKTLYKYVHSVHHRLNITYAYGALYCHPIEAILLDTLGSAVAESLACMTVRQATLFFVLNTLKTIDDHGGYALPWDPLRVLFGNNSVYHDIHHQAIGIKYNFSSLYFNHWDVLLGTRMTRDQMEVLRYKRKDTNAKTD